VSAGIAPAIANSWLDGLCRSITWSEPVAFYAKLHTGDPGVSGANNAAVETTRKAVTFSAAAGGSITNSAQLVWSSVAATETYRYVSFFDTVGPAGGTFLGSAQLAQPIAMTAGSTYTLEVGDAILNVTPIAA
jgi:hypothetical protein